ncbi:MAG: hypothetical protein ABJQ14_08445, partial [Hyphomicrobiales bacterium]
MTYSENKDPSPAILFLFGAICLALGVWLTPEHLSNLGIMDRSLASENPLTHSTALLEINASKIALLLMGVVSCLTALGYRHLTQLPAYQRFLSAKTIRPEPYQSHLSVFFSFSFWVMAVFLFFSALYFSFANDIFSRETLTWINLEDGFLETLSAVILIVASGYAVAVALRLRGTPQTAARLMHYFL